MSLLLTETAIELFLHWNPSKADKEVIEPIIKIVNWFLIGTIAQFCVFAFLLLLLGSVEELVQQWKDFRVKK